MERKNIKMHAHGKGETMDNILTLPFKMRKAENRLSYWERYAGIILKYALLGKCTNLARAYYHYLLGSTILPTMPAFLKVEISRKCSVNCRYCPEGKDDVFFPLKNYKALIDRLKNYIFLVSLYDIGEPLENDNIVEYIRYANDKKIGSVISTSLSVEKHDNFWSELIQSGISRIIAAIDGVSEDVYKQYRTNGNLTLVMSNLEKLLAYKKAYGSRTIIEWQMLDLPWSKDEQQEARKTAYSLGCNVFRLVPEATKSRRNYPSQNVIRRHNCLLPYLVFIVNAYNNVRPCYKLYTKDMIIGSLNNDTFESLWNGDEMAKIRDKTRICDRPTCKTCRE
jgi:radical SAM protein with 4Fe4S-binding SPASM domain